MHATRNGSSSARRTHGRGGAKKYRAPVGTTVPPAGTTTGEAASPFFNVAAVFETGSTAGTQTPFVFAPPDGNENVRGPQAKVPMPVDAEAGARWFSPSSVFPPTAAASPFVFPTFAASSTATPVTSAAGSASTAPGDTTWLCACGETRVGGAHDVCACGVLRSQADAAAVLPTVPHVAPDVASNVPSASPPPATAATTSAPPSGPVENGTTAYDELMGEKARLERRLEVCEQDLKQRGDDLRKSEAEKIRLELRLEANEHELKARHDDVKARVEDVRRVEAECASLRTRQAALEGEVVAARLQKLGMGVAPAPVPASSAALRESEVALKELRQELERERKAFQAERLRWKHEMEQRAAELKDVRQAERELNDRCKQLAADKVALERHAELARARSEAMAGKEAVARKEVQQTILPMLERAQAEGLRRFLRVIYERFPPKNPKHRMGSLDALLLDRTAKQALQHYHTDKQDVDMYGLVWRDTCNAILQILNDLRSK